MCNSLLKSKYVLLSLLFVLIAASCNKDKGNPSGEPTGTDVIENQFVSLNPSSFSPLSAFIELETSEEVRVSMRINGRNGSNSDFVHEFPTFGTVLTLPVHGLYADHLNLVDLTFYDRDGRDLGTERFEIPTEPLISVMPEIVIEEARRNDMADGMTLVSYFGHNGATFPQRPFIFDSYGEIRWYLDFNASPELGALFYDDGVERLSNGNFYFGSGGGGFGLSGEINKIYEVDLFGNIINTWEMPGYTFHHEVHEKPNGNFLVTVNKIGAATVEDHIIEIDRASKDIVNVWDLNLALQNSRTTWTDDTVDWFHANAVLYDERDDSIIVSGRTQGLVKLSSNNEVLWILAPHRDWGLSGNGVDLATRLLQPLDSNSQPITDPSVLQGTLNHPDFEWAWYQHAPLITPDGNLMLFDNGDNRNYVSSGPYSRAVEYRIDETNKTIQQLWQYGKERGEETYSRIVSDADYLESQDHILFSPGAILDQGAAHGKSIEIDYNNRSVLFEATIIPPVAFFDIITLHRTERITLYP
ncbi:MAG: aryl-sulfate sulfotransferase [Flavobacteriaceae bacterium]